MSLGLAVLGILLGVVAIVGYVTSPRDSGDAGPFEMDSTVAPEIATTTTTPPQPPASPAEPLWVANDTSLLGDAGPIDGMQPERLVIDSLELDAPIDPYGVDGQGRMDVPDNVTDVAWYEHGPRPGEPGSAVLAAHVDLRGAGRGLFYDLDELEVGETVVVRFDDRTSMSFEVVARATYLKTELPLEAIFRRQGEPVLTLVTCGGGFSHSSRSYDSNVVVYAVPADQPPVDGPESSSIRAR